MMKQSTLRIFIVLALLSGCGKDQQSEEDLTEDENSIAAADKSPMPPGVWNVLSGVVQKLFSSKTEIGSPILGHALPKGKKPFDMTGCKEGKQSFKKRVKSTLGFEIVNVEYDITYQYGCKYKGKGDYIANVRFLVTSSKVDPLWSLHVSGVSQDPTNAGTIEVPDAVLKFSVTFVADGVGSSSKTDEFQVRASSGKLEAKIRDF